MVWKKENVLKWILPLFSSYSIAGMNQINLIIISFRTNYHVGGAFWLNSPGWVSFPLLKKKNKIDDMATPCDWTLKFFLIFYFLNLRMILWGHHRGTDGLFDKNRQNSMPAWALVKRHGKSSSKLVFSNDQLLSIYMIKSFKINNSWIYVRYKS